MQKKFLFPLLYLFLILVAFVTGSDALFMILTAQMALIMLGIEILLGVQINTSIYILFLLEIIQFFFVGALWDRLEEKFGRKKR